MGTSDITVSALVAVPRVQGNKLAWTVTDNWPKGSHYSLGAVEVHASLTNDRATATKVGEGITDFHHAGLSEEVPWYYWIKARNKVGSGSYGAWYPVSATAGVSSKPLGQSGLGFTLSNGSLVASVAGNAMTIAIKTAAGTDPSASDPVYVAFRSSNLALGTYTIRPITSALSLVISSGSKLGTTDSTAFRIWVLLFDDAGTLRLGAVVCTTATQRFALNEERVLSSTAEGGAGAADSAAVVYTGTAVTAKAFRIVGSLTWDSGLGTAGNWFSTPTVVQMFGPGVKKPGEEVQSVFNETASVMSGSTAMPLDFTIPQNTEGDEYLSTPIIPTSKANWLEHEVVFHCGANAFGDAITAAMFRNSEASAFAASPRSIPGADSLGIGALIIKRRHLSTLDTTTTFKIRAGITVGGTATEMYMNGFGSPAEAVLGGIVFSSHTIIERAA